MSDVLVKALAGVGLAAMAVAASAYLRLGLAREITITVVRALVQLAAVGAAIALIFEFELLAFAFVAVMAGVAAVTAGGRMHGVPQARTRALAAIALPALTVTGLLLAVGAFDTTPRAAVPTAGILIGGAMMAATLSGRRMLEGLVDDAAEIEARLCLGDDARTALAPIVRRALRTGMLPLIDQTRSVGLVALPGTFVGLILGGASAEQAAATQLVVLLALLAVELGAGALITGLIQRALIEPGERVARF